MKGRVLWVGLLALLLLWPAVTVSADAPVVTYDEGQIFVDEDVTLQPGETINGDLGVFDGDIEMPAGSTVNGDLFVADGDATVAGRVNGDLAVIDGDLVLSESGQVNGDTFGMSGDQDIAGRIQGALTVLFGDAVLRNSAVVNGNVFVAPGTLEREAGAKVRGEMVDNMPMPPLPFLDELPMDLPEIEVPVAPPEPEIELPEIPARLRVPAGPSPFQQFGRFVGRVLGIIFFSALAIAGGMLVVLIWPRSTRRVSDCIGVMPLQSAGIGLLTFLIAFGLEMLALILMIVIILLGALMIATVILIPIGILLIVASVLVLLPVPLALVGGTVLGWVGISELLGRKVFNALKIDNPQPLSAALVGLVITVSLAAGLWLVMPLCCGWPFVILLTGVGLGAVIHTRFGTQGCQSAGTGAAPTPLPIEAMDEESGLPDGPVNGTP